MNKSALLGMVGMLAASLLSACGSSDDAQTASEGQPYNIVMQVPVVGDSPSGLADVEQAISKISEEKIGVTVTLEPVNAFNLGTETSLAVSSGEKLDLSLSLYSGVANLVSSGTIIELDELLETYGKDIVDITGIQLAGGIYDGNQYAVPISNVNGNETAFAARKDILDKYNITIDPDKIYSTEEIEEIFATVKEGEGDSFYILAGQYGQSDLPLSALRPVDFFGAGVGLDFTGNYDSTDVVNMYASDMYKEYAGKMYDWAQKGFYSPDAVSTSEGAEEQIASGKYLGVFANNSGTLSSEYSARIGTEMVSITTQPALATTSQFQATLWSIPSTSENPEKAMEFLNLTYNDPAITNLLMYGIEGVSYEVVEEDEFGRVIQPIAGESSATVPYWSNFAAFGNRLKMNIVSPSATTLNRDIQEFSDSVELQSPALGFVPNFDDVSTEYSAVNSVISQYRGIINSGAIDPEVELPEFLKALEAAGIEQVLEEVQSQFAEWQKSQ